MAADRRALPRFRDRVGTTMTAEIGDVIERLKRRGAISVFRLASSILRYATILHRQRKISHIGLRTVLSGTRWLERFGAWLARRKHQKIEQVFHHDSLD
jgi:hypothetical protein